LQVVGAHALVTRRKSFKSLEFRRRRAASKLFVQRLRGRFRKSLSAVDAPSREVFASVGYTKNDLLEHLLGYLWLPCEEKVGCDGDVLTLENFHIDHTVALRRCESIKDVIRLNQLDNLRLICKKCNWKKSSHLPLQVGEITMGLLESLIPKLNIEAIERQALEAAQKQGEMLTELKSINSKLAILVHVAEAWMKENGKS
jgi:5-methylcytosine-specific restriction endonuclease McrA